jgi:formamidopyrimidine-DNA glycosylase
MPELPEVETIARGLHLQLLSRTFTSVEVSWERTVDRPDVPSFCAALTGTKVVDVGRRGKFITMGLSTGQTLLTHLRMTGQLLIQPANYHPEPRPESVEGLAEGQPTPNDAPHTRVRFQLDDGRWLLFSDTRKFGRMYLVDDPLEVLGELGPEPLEDEFTPERLAAMLAGRRGRIKPLLLNQNFLAGLGNIYADEALWRARVHPLRGAGTLTPDEVARLHAGIVSVLCEALEEGGTSLRDYQYRQPDGDAGAYQDLLAIYGRAGGDCPRCGATIERLVVGQRGTYICPRCQVLGDD